MSFSSSIKEELSKVINYKNKELLEAEFFGYILTANSREYDNKIEYITENEFNIEKFYKILFNLGIDYDPSIKGKTFVASIKITDDIERILHINNIDNQDVQKAIVKGAFMGAGSITDPNKQYHLEIIFNQKEKADYIVNICKTFGILLKELIQEEKVLVYIKDAEEISKFLALLGSNKGVLAFEDVRITKEIKNDVVRKVNCETANLNKTIVASVDQINDIKLIQNMNKFDELSNDLKEIALLRIENPDDTLKQLGEKLEKQLGKSGVNHRLQRIHDFAEELRRG